MLPLLERDSQLSQLRAAMAEAEGGDGRMMLIGGEAGVGKSSLVEHLGRTQTPRKALFGICDPVGTPPALGPLLEVAGGLEPGLPAELLSSAAPGLSLFAALAAAPSLVIVEDVHWADQATLDVLRYLGRRVTRLPALILATFRSEDAGVGSPLGVLLGDLATAPGVVRMELPPLSLAATRVLVGGDAELLHRRTGGNPFFIREVMAGGGMDVPATVRDAVMARASRLSTAARAALEAAAVAGTRTPAARLAALLGRDGTPRWGMEEAMWSGFLVRDAGMVRFRHELVHAAIGEATPPVRRQQLHAAMLALLRDDPLVPDGEAALVHHAEGAGDAHAMLVYAPAAAARAAALSAHREAEVLYGKALAVVTAADQRARLTEARAHQLYLAGSLPDALDGHRTAAELWGRQGESAEQAGNLARVSYLSFLVGEHDAAEQTADAAVACLAGLPPGPELAAIYDSRSRLRFMASDPAGAVRWGERAHELALSLGDGQLLLDAAVTLGAARMLRGDADGAGMLRHALGDARARELEDVAARATLYLAWLPLLQRSYDGVERHLEEGLRYADEHELSYWRQLLAAARVRYWVDQGRWREAEHEAGKILEEVESNRLALAQVLIAVGALRGRQGREDVEGCLERATALVRDHPEVDAVSPVAPALVELAVLRGETGRAREIARTVLDRAGGAWEQGGLWFWARQAGDDAAMPAALPEPYALLQRGEWRASAAWWQARGCGYERAMTLSLSGDGDALRESVRLLDELDARAGAALVRRRLRALGMGSIPRGPRGFTRSNAAGLTEREHEVLSLIAEGLGNAGVARRLFLSHKTVERHVSAVLRKLDVEDRKAAVAAARRVGALDQDAGRRP
ncbi:MAG TPA: LuxR C-terminal-related transcriptional regulator [Candidatus Dormibacteraeota bacterium]